MTDLVQVDVAERGLGHIAALVPGYADLVAPFVGGIDAAGAHAGRSYFRIVRLAFRLG